jgi:hypothetical protein
MRPGNFPGRIELKMKKQCMAQAAADGAVSAETQNLYSIFISFCSWFTDRLDGSC